MKIALVTNGPIRLPWAKQGSAMEILNYEIAHRLAIKNSVVLFSQRIANQEKKHQEKNVLHIRHSVTLDKPFLFLSSLISKYLPSVSYYNTKIKRKPFFSSYIFNLVYCIQVALNCKKYNFDIVHLHNYSHFIPIFKYFNQNSKIVFHLHMEWVTQLDRKIIEKRIRKVDILLGCSEYISKKIRDKFPEVKDKCFTLYNGVDIDRFNVNKKYKKVCDSDNQRIVFVGRNSPEKGLHILVEAFQQLVKDYPNTELILIGPTGPAPVLRGKELILYLSRDRKVIELSKYYNKEYNLNLKNKIAKSNKCKISFIGYISRRKLLDFLSSADVFVFPSIWQEPFGMPIVEAMAMSLPVVSSKVGGIPEILKDNETGILVPPGDISALKKAILMILTNDGMRYSMGIKGRERVETYFSWEIITENLFALYLSLFQ